MKRPIQLGNAQYPIHCGEEEEAAKVETENTVENKVTYKLTGKPRA